MAWIYHNSELWVISMSSDWTNWLTIADKNLGATQVYNDGDTLSEANSGKYYQWWNNYWFPFTGSVTTSSSQVNAQNYWPWNYYSSSTFITKSSSPYDWDSSNNNNLWWDTTNTNEARKWPSPTWFHVPSITEWQWVKTIMDWLSLTTWDNWRIYLYIPFAGYRSFSTADLYYKGSIGYYWSSSPSGSDSPYYARRLYLDSSNAYASSDSSRANGYSVRSFANTPVIPDYTWTKLYWDDLPRPKIIKRFQNNWNYYYFKNTPTHASGVTLNKSSLTLTEVGQTEQLVATVTPSDAVEKSVTWTSSDTTVAMVARDWTVTCIDPTGVCTITCTTNDGWYSAICKIPYEYEPNENTLAYRPLDSVNQLADLSWNNLDLGIISQDASRISFIDNYALFVKDSSGMYSPTLNLPNSFTVACWVYPLEPDAMSYNSIWNWKRWWSDWAKYYQLSVWFWWDPFAYYASLYWVTSIHNTFSSRPNGWLRIVCTFDYNSWVTTMYINWDKVWTSTGTKWSNNYDQIVLWYWIEWAWYWHYLKIWSKLSNFIVEDKVWSDAEVLEDYNLTRWRYAS